MRMLEFNAAEYVIRSQAGEASHQGRQPGLSPCSPRRRAAALDREPQLGGDHRDRRRLALGIVVSRWYGLRSEPRSHLSVRAAISRAAIRMSIAASVAVGASGRRLGIPLGSVPIWGRRRRAASTVNLSGSQLVGAPSWSSAAGAFADPAAKNRTITSPLGTIAARRIGVASPVSNRGADCRTRVDKGPARPGGTRGGEHAADAVVAGDRGAWRRLSGGGRRDECIHLYICAWGPHVL